MSGRPSSSQRPDRGSASVMMLFYVIIAIAAAAMIFDGGTYLLADRYASNTAEGAARAAVATGSPSEGLSEVEARAAAVDHAVRLGISAADVRVEFPARDVVVVSVTERRNAVFVRFTGTATLAVEATGRARLEFS
ncbi:MAG: pilus assembly protein TadG-related protein [Actinomycetota bacterium]